MQFWIHGEQAKEATRCGAERQFIIETHVIQVQCKRHVNINARHECAAPRLGKVQKGADRWDVLLEHGVVLDRVAEQPQPRGGVASLRLLALVVLKCKRTVLLWSDPGPALRFLGFSTSPRCGYPLLWAVTFFREGPEVHRLN